MGVEICDGPIWRNVLLENSEVTLGKMLGCLTKTGPKLLDSTTRTLARYSDYHGSNVHKSKMNSYQEGNCFTAWEWFLIC